MFDSNPYLMEKAPDYRREALRRSLDGPSWLENAARLTWRLLRAALRALGHVFVGVGRLLLRLPQAAPAQDLPLGYSSNE